MKFCLFPKQRGEKQVELSHLFVVFSLYFGITLLFFPLLLGLFGFLMSGKLSGAFDYYKDLRQSSLVLLQLSLIIIVFTVLTLYLTGIEKETREEILFGEKEREIKKNLIKGASSWLIAYPLVLLSNALFSSLTTFFFGKHEVEQTVVKQLKELMSTPFIFLIAAFVVIFIVPFVEELLFRGFLQSWLTKKLGRISGILISSLFFASLHFSQKQGIGNFELIPSLFVLSCVLGYLYERQQNLFAPYALHATFNAMTVLFLLIGVE